MPLPGAVASALPASMGVGLHTVAAGANPVDAAETGIRVSRLKVGNLVVASTVAGLTGILGCFRIFSTDPQAGGATASCSWAWRPA